MGGSETKLSGPDFEKHGAATKDLAVGDKLLGHAFGDPVLLARIDAGFTAIGAMCTHYSGPLAEGVIVGSTVRCPWHHACFDLRTGEATRAPALNPVPCYATEVRGDHVFVTGKKERDPLSVESKISSADSPKRVVIVGSGAAGSAAAEMLRRRGFEGSITMIDAEPDSPYDRPNLSKDYLAGNAPEDWIPLRPPGFYEEHEIAVVRGTATRIDAAGKRVEMEKGNAVEYDALLLAPGAEPIHLPLAGSDLPHVHYLRSLADSRSIIEASKRAKRAVVIGSSFIGLEVAASLRARNLDVEIIAPESVPLEKVLGKDLGTFIRSIHEEHGVKFHLGHKPDRIEKDGVVMDDGTKVAGDLVVIGVGVKPRVGLAESAGAAMDRGVTVDEFLATSVPGIWAVGDIARWPDPHTGDRIRVEHWVVAQRMGQTAARNILGAREKFDFVPFFWSAHYDVSINYVGHAEGWDDIKVDGDASKHDVSVRYEKAGKLLALATIFRDQESLEVEVGMEQR